MATCICHVEVYKITNEFHWLTNYWPLLPQVISCSLRCWRSQHKLHAQQPWLCWVTWWMDRGGGVGGVEPRGNRSLLEAIFSRINALERRLQVRRVELGDGAMGVVRGVASVDKTGLSGGLPC